MDTPWSPGHHQERTQRRLAIQEACMVFIGQPFEMKLEAYDKIIHKIRWKHKCCWMNCLAVCSGFRLIENSSRCKSFRQQSLGIFLRPHHYGVHLWGRGTGLFLLFWRSPLTVIGFGIYVVAWMYLLFLNVLVHCSIGFSNVNGYLKVLVGKGFWWLGVWFWKSWRTVRVGMHFPVVLMVRTS